MGYDLRRFNGHVDEQLICPICSGVLENPVHAPVCQHAFCNNCIKQWLSQQMTCPVDRQHVSSAQLKPAPRILRNLLARLNIACDNASFGCTAIVKLHLLSNHCLECEFNPKKPVPCESGCGLIVPNDQLKDHNCMRDLRMFVQKQQEQYNELKREVNMIKDCVRAIRAANPNGIPAIVASLEQDEIERWSSSLQCVRVTRWGDMFSTPGDSLQKPVREALIDSGCPQHIINELMENSHEQRWPQGLYTFEIREINRRQRNYYNYVCRRIPGHQAVVVMTRDNSHMNEDMLLDPGLVMIFAHGIQ